MNMIIWVLKKEEVKRLWIGDLFVPLQSLLD